MARESGGNPLFIDELVKHIQGGEPIDRWEAIGQLDLDEVLWERIRRQPEDAQRLLGAVAVSGRPIYQSLAFQAAELGAGGRVALASLRTARLIRLIGQAQQDEIEIYHDRIRETVVAHLPRTACGGSTNGWRCSCRPPGRWTRRSWPVIIAGPATQPGRASITRAAPIRPRRRWRSITPPGCIGPRWRSTRAGGAGRPVTEETGRCPGQRRPGAEAAQAYQAAAGSADPARDPRAEAAGLDPAPDQRACRRGRRGAAHAARAAGHLHARDARACARVALVAPGDAPAPRAAVSRNGGSPGPADGATSNRPLLVGRRGSEHVRADPRGRLPGAGPALALRAGEPFRIARAIAMEAAHRASRRPAGIEGGRPAPGHGGRTGRTDRLAPCPRDG